MVQVTTESTLMPLREDSVTPKPELLTLSLFCRAIGSLVSASRIVGDTNEFSVEIARISDEAGADLVLVPWRASQFTEKIIWNTTYRSSVPVALVVDVASANGGAAKPSSQRYRSVLVLVSFASTDLSVLQLAKRLVESRAVGVTIVVPDGLADLCPLALRDAIEEMQYLSDRSRNPQALPNIAVNVLGFKPSSRDGYLRECMSNAYDVIITSFCEPQRRAHV